MYIQVIRRTPEEHTPVTPSAKWLRDMDSLPPWERQLLCNVRVMESNRIIVCLDSGAKEGKGSFGTVIASDSDKATLVFSVVLLVVHRHAMVEHRGRRLTKSPAHQNGLWTTTAM